MQVGDIIKNSTWFADWVEGILVEKTDQKIKLRIGFNEYRTFNKAEKDFHFQISYATAVVVFLFFFYKLWIEFKMLHD